MHCRHDGLDTSPDKPEQLGGTWWYRGVRERRGQGAILGFAQAGTLARQQLVQIRQLTPFSTAVAKIGFVDGGGLSRLSQCLPSKPKSHSEVAESGRVRAART